MDEQVQDVTTEGKLVIFTLDNEEYGVSVDQVQEVIEIPPITTIPNSPEYLNGFINLRGRIVLVIDLEKKFGLDRETASSEDGNIIVIDSGDIPFGVVVDSVTEVMTVDKDSVQSAPETVTKKLGNQFLSGVVVIGDESEGEQSAKEDGVDTRVILNVNLSDLLLDNEQADMAELQQKVSSGGEVNNG